ncbi:hypothetical protein VHEMI08251 [[Torrubiella] hemipterigena]|uniref:HAT C-terminal dimerisation domain-containing protein n=1 Tax=[Torrubiella] hemipterigena TaxID=1531966 RepID=A0A0A1TPE2_9HYPO|nr:hypothetical protein VHEMI08251 [[Torrubiella] hemipterigena]
MPLQFQDMTYGDATAFATAYILSFERLHAARPVDEKITGVISRWPRNYSEPFNIYKKIVDSETGMLVSWIKVSLDNTNLDPKLFYPNDLPADMCIGPGIAQAASVADHRASQASGESEYAMMAKAARERELGNHPAITLKLIGTHPVAQGRGAGSMLMRWLEKFADDNGLPCWVTAAPGKESWQAPAVNATHEIWLEKYKSAASPDLQIPTDTPSSTSRQCNKLDELLSDIAVTGPIVGDADDFEIFICAPPIRITGTALEWWLHSDQRKAYPRLSRIAIDILSIPPESSDAESHFSSTRRTLSWDRERMTCENLAKVECVGNWIREGIIVPKSRGGRGVISSVAVEFGMDTEVEVLLD